MDWTPPRRFLVPALAVALLAGHYILAVTAIRGKSNTFDELPHLWLGYTLWMAPGYKHVPTNGVISQMLGAYPLIRQPLNFPDPTKPPFSSMDQHWLARTFFYEAKNPASEMLWRARTAVALLGVAAGAFVFVWSRRLFGDWGGLLSLFLFTFCPLMLANSPLATADMAAALGFTAAIFLFWRVINDLTWSGLLLSSAALAFACAAKLSAVLLAPVFLMMALVRIFSRRPLSAPAFVRRSAGSLWGRCLLMAGIFAVHVCIVTAVLWVIYNFQYAEISGSMARDAAGFRGLIMTAIAKSGLLPPAFVEGVTATLLATDAAPAFLSGRYSLQGWWWFFPYAFLVKTPLPILALFAAAPVAWMLWARTPSKGKKHPFPSLKAPPAYEITPIVCLLLVYGLASIATKMNIGVRHILPLYPALFVVAGANIWWFRPGGKLRQALAGFLLAGVLVTSFTARPDYMAFFNLLAGGSSNGYRHLVDSSLDWGQDLPGLKSWLDANAQPGDEVYLSYFGTSQPEYFGIKAHPLPRHHDWGPQQLFPLKGGLYCISATMLQSVYSPFPGPWCEPYEKLYQEVYAEMATLEAVGSDRAALDRLVAARGRENVERLMAAFRQLRFARLCALLRTREPDAQIGHSILVFRLTDEEAKQAVQGPPAELVPRQADFKRNSGIVK